MKKHVNHFTRGLFCAVAALAAFVLSGCTTVSKNPDGSHTTDFKASTDANAKMYEAQADVMFEAQKTAAACFARAMTDIQIAFCAMSAQSVNFAQAHGGRPQANRNPQSGAEANAQVGAAAVKAVGATATAAAVATAVSDGFQAQAAAGADAARAQAAQAQSATTSQAEVATAGISAAAKPPTITTVLPEGFTATTTTGQ
jgi:hypothetical protein